MLGPAIGDLIPAALAVALSPIPIVAIVLVLSAPRARTAGPAFATGWVAGLAVATTLIVLAIGGATGGSDDEGGTVDWLLTGIGVLFLALAAKTWKKRPARGETADLPAWMASIDSVSALRAVGLGLALSAANPKNLALTLAAGAAISDAGLGDQETAIAIAAFVLIGSSTVAGAVLLSLLAGERVAGPLASVRQFMADNNAVIMFIVLLLLGGKFLGDGLGALWS